jgi:hypothetical protein
MMNLMLSVFIALMQKKQPFKAAFKKCFQGYRLERISKIQ